MNAITDTPDNVLDFWFTEISPKQQWAKSEELDRHIEARFGALHRAAAQSELFTWRESASGRLAEIIVLDQFSRNIYRDKPQAFACDSLALALAQTAVVVAADREIDIERRSFLYMPYMHSESAAIHAIAQSLFATPGMENNYQFELKHKAIIDRFDRYPHRNAILGRASTPDEIEFLKTAGSGF